eukprot:UN33552
MNYLLLVLGYISSSETNCYTYFVRQISLSSIRFTLLINFNLSVKLTW